MLVTPSANHASARTPRGLTLRVACEGGCDLRGRDERVFVDTDGADAAEHEAGAAAPVPKAGTAPVPRAGGKAKASKGRGRAPAVKGQPRIGKRRQSR